jgi:hypothetical protein
MNLPRLNCEKQYKITSTVMRAGRRVCIHHRLESQKPKFQPNQTLCAIFHSLREPWEVNTSIFDPPLRTKNQEDNPMIKVFRFVAVCTISVAFATWSIAWAQSYTTVDYPGAVLTELIGGPNPQGTSVGGYTLTAGGALHAFTVRGGVFTPFDPPGSTFTTANFINPRGDIVGAYVDSGGVSHGFVLSGGTYTTVDYPGAAGTALSSVNPSGEMSGATCSDPACGVFGATNVTTVF